MEKELSEARLLVGQYEAKMKSLNEAIKEADGTKRQLEEQVDTLNEEVSKLQAAGNFQFQKKGFFSIWKRKIVHNFTKFYFSRKNAPSCQWSETGRYTIEDSPWDTIESTPRTGNFHFHGIFFTSSKRISISRKN